jgi:hypothetical protein
VSRQVAANPVHRVPGARVVLVRDPLDGFRVCRAPVDAATAQIGVQTATRQAPPGRSFLGPDWSGMTRRRLTGRYPSARLLGQGPKNDVAEPNLTQTPASLP